MNEIEFAEGLTAVLTINGAIDESASLPKLQHYLNTQGKSKLNVQADLAARFAKEGLADMLKTLVAHVASIIIEENIDVRKMLSENSRSYLAEKAFIRAMAGDRQETAIERPEAETREAFTLYDLSTRITNLWDNPATQVNVECVFERLLEASSNEPLYALVLDSLSGQQALHLLQAEAFKHRQLDGFWRLLQCDTKELQYFDNFNPFWREFGHLLIFNINDLDEVLSFFDARVMQTEKEGEDTRPSDSDPNGKVVRRQHNREDWLLMIKTLTRRMKILGGLATGDSKTQQTFVWQTEAIPERYFYFHWLFDFKCIAPEYFGSPGVSLAQNMFQATFVIAIPEMLNDDYGYSYPGYRLWKESVDKLPVAELILLLSGLGMTVRAYADMVEDAISILSKKGQESAATALVLSLLDWIKLVSGIPVQKPRGASGDFGVGLDFQSVGALAGGLIWHLLKVGEYQGADRLLSGLMGIEGMEEWLSNPNPLFSADEMAKREAAFATECQHIFYSSKPIEPRRSKSAFFNKKARKYQNDCEIYPMDCSWHWRSTTRTASPLLITGHKSPSGDDYKIGEAIGEQFLPLYALSCKLIHGGGFDQPVCQRAVFMLARKLGDSVVADEFRRQLIYAINEMDYKAFALALMADIGSPRIHEWARREIARQKCPIRPLQPGENRILAGWLIPIPDPVGPHPFRFVAWRLQLGLEVAPGLVVDLLDTLKRLLFGMPVDRYVDLSEQLANSMRVQCSWHVIDRPMSGEQLRADQARHAIGDTTACSNHFWSEVTGWMRTTEFFKVGEENLLRELWSAIGAADYYAKDWEEGVENLDVARYGGPGVFRVNHSPDRFKRRWLHLEIEAC